MPSEATVFPDGAARCFSSGFVDRIKHAVSLRLLLVSALLIFSPLLEGGTTHLAVMVIRLAVLALVAIHLWTGIRRGALPRSLEGLGPAVLAYLALAGISTLVSPYTGQSLQWLLVLFTYAGLLYVLLSVIREWNHAFTLFWVVVGVGLIEAGVAIVQWWLGSVRPTGTFFNPNFLAGYLGAVGTLLLGLLSRGTWKDKASKFSFGLALVAYGFLLWGIILTGSRGGMLAWVAGTAVVLAMRFGRKALGLLLVTVVVGLVVPNPLRDRLWAEHTLNPVAYTRLQIWQSSIKLVADHPWGGGLGLYQYLYSRYSVPVEGQIARYGKTAQTAHNEYVQMAVELGVLSLPIFFWGVAVIAQRVRTTLKRALDPRQHGLVLGATGAIVVILVQAAVDSPFHEPALAILLTLCVALALSAFRLSGDPKTTSSFPITTTGSRWLWAGAGGIAVLALAVLVLRLGLAWGAFETGSRAFSQQRTPEAIARYEVAVSLDPGKALYHSSLAAAYYQLFQHTHDDRLAKLAAEELEEAAALNPLDGRLEGLRAGLYRSFASSEVTNDAEGRTRQRRWLDRAHQALERAIQLEPYNPFHHLEFGRLLWHLGKPEAAEASVRHAVELEPNFLPGREWLARHYLQTGRVEAAQQQLHEIMERQTHYGQWPKDQVEENYLKVDVKSLQAAFQKARG